MAGCTIGPILPVMFIFVTCHTLAGCTFINAVLMAFCTLKIRMFSHQREAGIVVIEVHIAPAAGGMAGTAIRAELSVMCVLAGMTGITI